MLREVFYNRLALFGSGRKYSYDKDVWRADRRRYYDALQVAFRLAKAIGLVKDGYFDFDGYSGDFKVKVSENLMWIKRVALVLERLKKEGWIKEICNGKIFYHLKESEFSRRDVIEAIFGELAIDYDSDYTIWKKRDSVGKAFGRVFAGVFYEAGHRVEKERRQGLLERFKQRTGVPDSFTPVERDKRIRDIETTLNLDFLHHPGTKEEMIEGIFDHLMSIKGRGLDKGTARRGLNAVLPNILVEEGGRRCLDKAKHFLSTWGFYDLLISQMARNMACGEVICKHKREEAAKVAAPPYFSDDIFEIVEQGAQEINIETIKIDLEADKPKIIPEEDGVLPTDFVISDIHLRERPHGNTDDLLRFIWMVAHLDGRLILAGDTFDVWGAWGLERCWVENARIVNALTKLREVVIVAGNHDEFLRKLADRGGIFANPRLKVVENYVSLDKRVRIFHGHQFDRFNRPGSWVGRWVTRIFALFEALIRRKILDWLSLVQTIFLPPKVEKIMKWLISEVQQAGIELSDKKPIYFIIGHIHYPGISFLIEKLDEAVKEKYPGGEVKLFVTDSWTNEQGYIGDYVALAQRESGERIVTKKVWLQREKSPSIDVQS